MQILAFDKSINYKIIDYFSERLFEAVSSVEFNSFCMKNDIVIEEFEQEYLEKKYAHISNNLIFLDFSNDFVMALKKARDAYLINRLENNIIEELNTAKETILKYKNKIDSILLIGSAARNKMRIDSDIDILIISKSRVAFKLNNLAKKVQIIQYGTKDFHTRYINSEEIVIWALKYGLILYDDDFISEYYRPQLKFISNKVLIDKRMMINKISKKISNSKFLNDQQLRSELIKLAYQMARYKLLKNGEMPKSKKEIVSQISEMDKKIADTILLLEERKENKRENMLKIFYGLTDNFKTSLINR